MKQNNSEKNVIFNAVEFTFRYFYALYRELREKPSTSHIPKTSFSAEAYDATAKGKMHPVFVNFPEIDNRVRPLSVNDVSYDLMQQIAAQSEVELSTHSAPIPQTPAAGSSIPDIPEESEGSTETSDDHDDVTETTETATK